MNLVDGVLLGLLLLSALIGLWRGLVYEVLSVAAWIAAFLLAQRHAEPVAQWLPLTGWAEPLRLAAGFLLVFVGTAFAGGLLAWLVKKLVASVGLRPIDRVLGAVFGLLRGWLILLALAIVVSMTALRSQPAWQASVAVDVLQHQLQTLRPLLPAAMARYLP